MQQGRGVPPYSLRSAVFKALEISQLSTSASIEPPIVVCSAASQMYAALPLYSPVGACLSLSEILVPGFPTETLQTSNIQQCTPILLCSYGLASIASSKGRSAKSP